MLTEAAAAEACKRVPGWIHFLFHFIWVHESTKELAYINAIRSKLDFFYLSALDASFCFCFYCSQRLSLSLSHTHTHGCNKYVRNLHIFARRSFSLRLLLCAFHYSILSSSRQVWRGLSFSVTSSKKKQPVSIENVSDFRHNHFQRNFSSFKINKKSSCQRKLIPSFKIKNEQFVWVIDNGIEYRCMEIMRYDQNNAHQHKTHIDNVPVLLCCSSFVLSFRLLLTGPISLSVVAFNAFVYGPQLI